MPPENEGGSARRRGTPLQATSTDVVLSLFTTDAFQPPLMSAGRVIPPGGPTERADAVLIGERVRDLTGPDGTAAGGRRR
ncbi:hypothetical protein GCM10010415_58280 [Streptomyces atrovirens]